MIYSYRVGKENVIKVGSVLFRYHFMLVGGTVDDTVIVYVMISTSHIYYTAKNIEWKFGKLCEKSKI